MSDNEKQYDEDTLDLVFGKSSSGSTPERRAATSSYRWVRSQDMLALDSPKATGLKMSSVEALETFGFDVLLKCIEDAGVCICRLDEPAASLRRVRERLGYSQEKLAELAEVNVAGVRDAENARTKTSMDILVPICIALMINPLEISFRSFE